MLVSHDNPNILNRPIASQSRNAALNALPVVFAIGMHMLGGEAVLATENPAPPVIANGSFETNTTDGNSTYQPLYEGFAGLPGWRFSPSPSPVLIGTPDDTYPYATPFGRWQVDLSGSDNATGGWMETDVIGMTAGRDYRITFDIGASTAFLNQGQIPSIRVAVGSANSDFAVSPSGIIEWVSKGVEFRATSSIAVLRFENTSPSGVGYIAVDNVGVTMLSTPPEIKLTALPGGQVRIEFVGELQRSTDLVEWISEPGLSSGTIVATDLEKRFYRAVAD